MVIFRFDLCLRRLSNQRTYCLQWHAMRNAVQAVELCRRIARTTAFRTTSVLERFFRDVQTMRHHVFASEPRYGDLRASVLWRSTGLSSGSHSSAEHRRHVQAMPARPGSDARRVFFEIIGEPICWRFRSASFLFAQFDCAAPSAFARSQVCTARQGEIIRCRDRREAR